MFKPGPMLSVLFSLVLSSFLFYVTEYPASAQAKGTPNMVLKQQIHDFKNVLEGELLEHSFEVLNQGDETLKIERVKPDCSCSVVHFDSVIPPKGEGKITVKIDTKGFDGPERWVVKVFSNDPKWKEATLDLRANVKTVITLSGIARPFQRQEEHHHDQRGRNQHGIGQAFDPHPGAIHALRQSDLFPLGN